MKYRSILFAIFACAIFALSLTAQSNTRGGLLPINPREQASVTISFDGLMAICFGDAARVSAGILDVHHHIPLIKVEKVTGTQRTLVAQIKGEELRGVAYIDVENSGSRGVSRYFANSMAEDKNDFRWTIDMESDLHQRQLYIKEDRLFGKIHFTSGLFYANKLSEEKVKFQSAKGNELPFNRQVAEPAAKLNLNVGETLVIKTEDRTLRLPAERDICYEIAITNTPPADMANINHWLFYYDLLEQSVTPYEPVMVKKAAYYPPPVMCAAAVFSRSKLN
jgi:hypothetical protein